MKKFTLAVLVVLFSFGLAFGQATLVVKAPAGNNATSTSRAPNGNVAHTTMRGCYLVTPNELGQYFVPGTNLASMGFSLTAGVTGAPVTGNFTVYLQNTSDATYQKGTSFTTAIAPMTSVYASTMTIPVSAGTTSINLTFPSAFTYTGGGLYVAYDWACSGPFSSGTATYVCDNSQGSSGAANATNVSTPNDIMNISNFRPVLIWGAANSATNDAQVVTIESLGSVPAFFNTGHQIKAYVKNGSNTTMNNIPVTLTVGGANTFADTKTITTLASGGTTFVTFSPFNPQTNGINSISVTVPTDQLPLNNQKIFSQTVTCSDQGLNPRPGSYPIGVGYNTSSGIIAAKLVPLVTSTCVAARISISSDAATPNNSVFGVLMDNTGNIIASSNTVLITNAMLNTTQTFSLNPPTVLTGGVTYYIGLAQPANTVTGYFPLAATSTGSFATMPPNIYVTSILGGGFVSTLTQNLGYFGIEARFAHTATTAAVANPTTSCSGSSVTLSALGGSTYVWSSGQTTQTAVVTPTTSLTYSVTGTNTIGCKSTATVAVNVIQNPTVTTAVSNSVICSGNTTSLTTGGNADTYTWSTSSTNTMITVSPTVTSVYSVVGTNTTTGCSTTATVGVTVDTPTIAIASPSAICVGTAAPLYASGANTYTWSTGSTGTAIAVAPLVTTSYSIAGTNTTGCVGTQTVQVIVNPNPTVTAVALPQASLCTGNSFTLSMNGAANYTAFSSGAPNTSTGTTVAPFSAVYSPTVTETYTVVGSYSTSCSNTKTLTVTVLSCVGIKEQSSNESGVSIYPNPSNGVFALKHETFQGNSRAEVYNVLGTLVKQYSISAENTTINLSEQSNGVYFVKLYDNGKVINVSRIVKQ